MTMRQDSLTAPEKYLTSIRKICRAHAFLFRHFSEVCQLYVLVDSGSFPENSVLYGKPNGGSTLLHPDGTHGKELKDVGER